MLNKVGGVFPYDFLIFGCLSCSIMVKAKIFVLSEIDFWLVPLPFELK